MKRVRYSQEKKKNNNLKDRKKHLCRTYYYYYYSTVYSKDVQIMYSAFGRETNGVKKLKFSETNNLKKTYFILLQVLVNKFPEVREKEFSSTLSRWFSGAKDRDGGEKERMAKK